MISTFLLISVLTMFVDSKTVQRRDVKPEIPDENRFNYFDLELLQKVASTQSGNVLVSPASVKATLGLILEAAGGRSAEQIRHALRLPENQVQTRIYFREYLRALNKEDGVSKVVLSNKVFLSQSVTPEFDLKNSVQEYYLAQVDSVDFKHPNISDYINKWIQDVTCGLITTLLKPGMASPATDVLLGNAIFFKGFWKNKFDLFPTNKECFTTMEDRCSLVNMIETRGDFHYSYISSLDAYAVELPYKGDKYSMLIVLPKSLQPDMRQLLKDIAHVTVHEIINQLIDTEMVVSIPRFEFDYTLDLVDTLIQLGVTDVFSDKANFTALYAANSQDKSARIGNVFHKTKILVNEEGSEAAAATGIAIEALMSGASLPLFRADHPFLFLVRDTTSGATLFAGRVSEPTPATLSAEPPLHAEPLDAEVDVEEIAALLAAHGLSKNQAGKYPVTTYVNTKNLDNPLHMMADIPSTANKRLTETVDDVEEKASRRRRTPNLVHRVRRVRRRARR